MDEVKALKRELYVYIHEISEGCVGIAVVAVSKYYYSNDILLGVF